MQTISRKVQIRPLRSDDVDVVAQILRESPEAATWSPTSLQVLRSETGELAFVSDLESCITGFIVARQVADEAEILNLAVSPRLRRAGHATGLLLAVLQVFRQKHVGRVFLEVRESNAAALAFYRKHGFVPTGRRKAYYFAPREDALLLTKKLTT